MKKGYLITFEGAEGSGKSTQIRHAVRLFKRRGWRVAFFREPGGSRVSEAIRKILLDRRLSEMRVETELLLYLAARSELVREKIEPALQKGHVVVLDRWEDSTLAYQGCAGGVPLALIRTLNSFVRGRLIPDLTFLLDVNPRKGLKRAVEKRGPDRVEQKPLAFHEKVRRGFLKLARLEPKRFVVLPAGESVEKIRKKIEAKLNEYF